MSVFVVVIHWHYDSSDVLGVFGSIDRAKAFAAEYVAKRPGVWTISADGMSSQGSLSSVFIESHEVQ